MKSDYRLIRKYILHTVKWVNLSFLAAIICLPILWVIISSFKQSVDITSIPPAWIFKPTINNYINVIVNRELPKFLINSAIIAVSSTALVVFIGSICAYSLARFKYSGGNSLAIFILCGRMVPPITLVIPYFIMMNKLGLIDTHFSIILTHIGFNLPFVVWLMRSFFMDIPKELEDAGRIDGCTNIGVFIRIILPLAGPGLATAAIFSFLYSWNEFLYAFILTKVNAVTVPVLAAMFVTPIGVLWGELFSVVIFVIAPMLVLGFIIRRYFVKGLTLGAVKG